MVERPSLRRAAILAGAMALLCVYMLLGAQARAQTATEPFGEGVLLQTTLSNPSNLDATLRYAVGARQAGDVEASIGALERLLFFNPKLALVRFELGALYFRLGSYEMARGYFESAETSPDAPADMKQRAQEFLDTIEKKLQPDQFSGFAQTGFRFQTNASLGPSQQSLVGATRTVNSQLFAQPDWNWFGIVGLNYVHDFGNQNGDVIEANLLAYDAQQFKASAVDTGFLDIRVGPRFGVLQGVLNGASIKPYVVVTGAMLADVPYFGSAGGGVTMHLNWANVAFDPYVEVRRSGYQSSGLYPLASGLDGTLTSVGVQAAGQIVEGVRWQSRLAFYHSDDAFAWYSYDRYAFDFSFPATVPSPWGGRNWIVTPSFGVGQWLYRQPDPIVNPFITEHDLDWRVGLGLDIPIKDRFGLGLQVQYRVLNSNVPGNTVRDLAVTMGPTVSF
ncbi:tetratricopeptide repeat protein [Methylocapsa polymorpha]|uniref:Tetratricopeptide repeat protein n=1 Tax=Methylocapsa polymorpha TaxID=3080828 RepID=A0ABZ0HST3_9HYPH|nr:tetratricopeptide repeat protein [Methylocapsa sp. RX1]